ncbi:uncharacterized protein [Ptychodera flava]|uniref:uncharacterized protein n=1 Tax=Ptychodera flava TaxID=63121 RepID=UPI00396A2F11
MSRPAQPPMIGVALMEDFVNGLPSFFDIRWNEEAGQPTIHQDPSRVNVFVHSDKHSDDFPDTKGGIIHVHTEEEFEAFVGGFLSKPMFFDVFCQNRKRSGNFRIITTAYFAVLVNSSHPRIKEQLENGLDQARKCIRNGDKFALEFDFKDIVKSWFADTLDGGALCNGSYYSKYGRICITNHTKYQHCFDCSSETFDFWVCCLPCCLLSCPTYTIYRKFTCKDIQIKMTGDICALAVGGNRPLHTRRDPESTDIEIPTQVVLAPPTYEETAENSRTGPESVALPEYAPPAYEDIVKETTSDTAQLIAES